MLWRNSTKVPQNTNVAAKPNPYLTGMSNLENSVSSKKKKKKGTERNRKTIWWILKSHPTSSRETNKSFGLS